MLQPRALDRKDTALAASAFGALYGVGGLVAMLALALNDAAIVDRALMAGVGAASLLFGLVCLVGYRRLPQAFFHFAAVAGVAIVTLAATASERGAEAVYAPFFAFVAMLAMLFFRLGPAIAGNLLALGAYAGLLYARDTPFATHLLLSSIAMLASLGLLIFVVRTRNSRIAGELSSDAYTDVLTRAPNRRSFEQRLELELERADRQGTPLSLVICDLDHFKRVNDEHGHDAGDVMLRRAAETIERTTRTVDLAARIGGEEFGLVLPDAAPEDAVTVAERVRHAIADEFDREGPAMTISCGIASASGADADRGLLFSAADRALYGAKRAGRNCTAIASGEEINIVAGGSPIGRLRQSLSSG